MLHTCKLHFCTEHVQASAIPHICATCMLIVYVTCAAYTHACYRYAAQVSLACMHMHITTALRTCCLHTCKLLVFLICATCIHAYYYSPAYMPLTHMQATSVPHVCNLHTCILLVLHTCHLHTCKLLVFLICAACIHAYY